MVARLIADKDVREYMAAAGRAARRRIKNEIDERIVIQAALDCLDRVVP